MAAWTWVSCGTLRTTPIGSEHYAPTTTERLGRHNREAWTFYMPYGLQDWKYGLDNRAFAWAVHDGDVSAIPEPSLISLVLSGLGALTAITRRVPAPGSRVPRATFASFPEQPLLERRPKVRRDWTPTIFSVVRALQAQTRVANAIPASHAGFVGSMATPVLGRGPALRNLWVSSRRW